MRNRSSASAIKLYGVAVPLVNRSGAWMSIETDPNPVKPIRADARRNHERVLDAARVCFARAGTEAQIDEVAAVAGVGVGTVYRHFETKEALVAALAAEHF